MTLEELAELIAAAAEQFQRSPSHWQFVHEGIPMACLFDLAHDRMRMIAAITEVEDLDDEQKDALLEANFHTALDARYGTSNGLVFAAFIHPLAGLDAALARSALDQVASLVHSFGTDYSSGVLEFVGGPEGEDEGDDEGPLLN